MDPVHIFFDTEFTQLSHEAKLISVGLISEDGKEFYAELSDTWDPSNCSEFVKCEVLPHLEGGVALMTLAELCLRMGNWLESFEVPVSLVTDAPTWDWPWIDYIFCEKHLRPVNLESTPEFFSSKESKLQSLRQNYNLQIHNALDDARVLRMAWLENKTTNSTD
jgi:hypothetical protein